ncbi:hypothetical protein [Thiolapillus sp.]
MRTTGKQCGSAASRLLGTTSLRFALHGWQRRQRIPTANGAPNPRH